MQGTRLNNLSHKKWILLLAAISAVALVIAVFVTVQALRATAEAQPDTSAAPAAKHGVKLTAAEREFLACGMAAITETDGSDRRPTRRAALEGYIAGAREVAPRYESEGTVPIELKIATLEGALQKLAEYEQKAQPEERIEIDVPDLGKVLIENTSGDDSQPLAYFINTIEYAPQWSERCEENKGGAQPDTSVAPAEKHGIKLTTAEREYLACAMSRIYEPDGTGFRSTRREFLENYIASLKEHLAKYGRETEDIPLELEIAIAEGALERLGEYEKTAKPGDSVEIKVPDLGSITIQEMSYPGGPSPRYDIDTVTFASQWPEHCDYPENSATP